MSYTDLIKSRLVDHYRLCYTTRSHYLHIKPMYSGHQIIGTMAYTRAGGSDIPIAESYLDGVLVFHKTNLERRFRYMTYNNIKEVIEEHFVLEREIYEDFNRIQVMKRKRIRKTHDIATVRTTFGEYLSKKGV